MLAGGACSPANSGSQGHASRPHSDVGDVGDVQGGADLWVSTDSAGEHGTPDAAFGIVDADATRGPDFPNFNPANWRTAGCSGQTSMMPVSESEFEIPDRAPAPNPVRTESEQRALFSGNGVSGYTLLADPTLHACPDWVYDLFAEEPQDVRLYFYPVLTRNDALLAHQRLLFTLLVDYEPVQATWTRWDAERTSATASNVGSSFVIESPKQVELVDIVIPAEVFQERRAYEIALAVESSSSVRSTDLNAARRIVLYNGGFGVPDRPCTAENLGAESLPIEVEARGVSKVSLIFSDATESIEQLRREPTYIEGGTSVTLYGSLYRRWESASVMALRPTANGEPFGSTMWFESGGVGPAPGSPMYIDARFSFTYDVPTEPGLYEVVVMSWEDPFESWRDLDGNRIPGVTSRSSPTKHSNSIRFVVQEQGDP